MRLSRVLVFCGLLVLVCMLFAACGGSGGGSKMMTVQPLMITTSSPLPQAAVNNPYSDVLQASGGTGTYTWSIVGGTLPAGLMFSSMQALISGTPTVSGNFSFTAQVMDGGGNTATAMLTLFIEGALIINCNSCAMGTSNLPVGSPGSPYSATLSASGGVAPYTWCVVEANGTCDNGSGGGLPPGLTLSTSTDGNYYGIISGTPTSQPAGPLAVTFQARDSETIAATGSGTFTLTIFSIATKTLPNGVINQPYKAANGQNVVVLEAGGVAPFTWSVSSGSLPPGLTFGPCMHVQTPSCPITGTPTQLGLSTFTLSVSDGETPPAMASQQLSIDVTDSTLRITTTTLPPGNVNLPYNAVLQATGGDGNNTWSLAGGNLPAGLNLSASTGAISGTPTTQGTSSFVVQVQDGENPPQTAMSGTLSITVNAAVTNSLLNGNFAIAFIGYNSGTPFLLAASFMGDGMGNIVSGRLDHNDGFGSEINNPAQCGGNPNCPIPETIQTGSTYDLSAGNGLGTLTINTLDANNNPHTYKFEMAVSGNACTPGQPSTSACGRLIQRDPGNPQTYGSGVLKIQNSTYFSSGAFFPGNFAVLVNGFDPNQNRYAAAGAIGTNPVTGVDVDCNGNGWHLSGCPLNQNDNGSPAYNPFPGSQFSANIDSATGRGEFVNLRFPNDPNGYCLGGVNNPNCGYAYYVIDKQEVILISSDPYSKPANLTLWFGYRQKSFATGWTLQQLSGPIITQLTGVAGGNSDVTAGILTASGTGTATFAGDENDNGTLSQPSSTSGTYALTSNGNVSGGYALSGFSQPSALNGASVYLYSGDFGYFVGADSKVTSGILEGQTGGPFSTASVVGALAGGTELPAVSGVTNSVFEMFADGVGDITATQYTSGPGGVGGPNNLTLSYSVDNTGRAVIMQNGNEFGVLYVIGPNEFVLLPAGSNPALSVLISGQAN